MISRSGQSVIDEHFVGNLVKGSFNKTLEEQLCSFQVSPGGKPTLFKFYIKKDCVLLLSCSFNARSPIVSSTAVMPDDPCSVNLQEKAFPVVKWRVQTSVKLNEAKVFLQRCQEVLSFHGLDAC